MSPLEIQKHLRNSPFEPFRVHMSDGFHYEIRHPEMALLTQRQLYIALYRGGKTDGVPSKSVFCDPLHITRIEPIDTQSAAG